GARPVSGRELITRLRASGLRVLARDRPRALRRALSVAWELSTARVRLPAPQTEAMGADLIERWAQPHRRYHDLRHLRDVLAALDILCEPDKPPVEVVLAAWFHDAIYNGEPGADEQASADLARTNLTAANLPATAIEEVARLALLTRTHSPDPGDHH